MASNNWFLLNIVWLQLHGVMGMLETPLLKNVTLGEVGLYLDLLSFTKLARSCKSWGFIWENILWNFSINLWITYTCTWANFSRLFFLLYLTIDLIPSQRMNLYKKAAFIKFQGERTSKRKDILISFIKRSCNPLVIFEQELRRKSVTRVKNLSLDLQRFSQVLFSQCDFA